MRIVDKLMVNMESDGLKNLSMFELKKDVAIPQKKSPSPIPNIIANDH